MANAASASTALVCRVPQLFSSTCTCRYFPLRRRWFIKTGDRRIYASVSAATPPQTRPDDLVASIVSNVMQAYRGVLLTRDENRKVAEMATDLQRFCVNEPVKCPLIFGEWDVLYCLNLTSPGGGYRSSIGLLFFKTNKMIQVVEAPDTVRNRVFSLLGLLEGEVSLKGKQRLSHVNSRLEDWSSHMDGESEVKLEITYIDEKIMTWKRF